MTNIMYVLKRAPEKEMVAKKMNENELIYFALVFNATIQIELVGVLGKFPHSSNSSFRQFATALHWIAEHCNMEHISAQRV